MKIYALNYGIYTLLSKEDIRPSQLRRITDSFINGLIYYAEDFCQKSEEELLSLDGMDEKVLSIMKKKLGEYGLSLGMTPEELSNYEDAEYYKRHPEERPLKEIEEISDSESDEIASKDFDVLFRSQIERSDRFFDSVLDNDEQVSHDSQDFVPLTNGLKSKILCKHEEYLHNRFKDEYVSRGAMRLYPDDIEFMRLRFFSTFLIDQPWYVRLLQSYEKRISKAKQMAETETQLLLSEIENDWVKARKEKYAKEIETNWKNNWQSYLNEIK